MESVKLRKLYLLHIVQCNKKAYRKVVPVASKGSIDHNGLEEICVLKLEKTVDDKGQSDIQTYVDECKDYNQVQELSFHSFLPTYCTSPWNL